MTWDKHATPTTRTKLHQQLTRVIEDLGFGCVEEKPVGKYWLDCFIEEAWVGVEADGKASHAGKSKQNKDSLRDEWIMINAGIPVLRIYEADLRNKAVIEQTKQKIMDFVVHWSETAEHRRKVGSWI